MQRRLLVALLGLAISVSGCIFDTCNWYGCEDLGGGFCIWYEGQRADLVYVDSTQYADDCCNQSVARSVFSDVHDFQHSDRFVLFNEWHKHHSELPSGWANRLDERPTGVYHWFIDKEAKKRERSREEVETTAQQEYLIFGPYDSIGFAQQAAVRGIDSDMVRAILETKRDTEAQ